MKVSNSRVRTSTHGMITFFFKPVLTPPSLTHQATSLGGTSLTPPALRCGEENALVDDDDNDVNNDWCELCYSGGDLLCCDTCSNSCHLEF
jgi:hypothetical protein